MENRTIKNRVVFIVAFTSANFTLKLYKNLKEKRYRVVMISTPCTISSGCSRSLEVEEEHINVVIDEIINSEILIQGIFKKVIKNGRYVYEEVNLEDIE